MKKNSTIIIIILLLIQQSYLFAQKINTENLNKFIDYCNESKADEIILSVQGKTISHWKRTDYNNVLIDSSLSQCNTPFMGTASMVKSWTGILIGILIDKRYINSEDDLVCKYLPEWEIGCKNNITIKHLLTMTAGFGRLGGNGILSQTDMNKFALNLKPETTPDTKFEYSNESVQILGLLAERVTKLKGDILFKKFILEPMAMDSTSFSKDSIGNFIYYGGCTTTVKNAHKFGLMMLNNGKYNKKQIVSENWIKKSTAQTNLASYYGYLWWIDKNSKYWNYAAIGDVGQMTIIFPELDIVFIRKQSCDLSTASKNMSWMGTKFLSLIASVVEK